MASITEQIKRMGFSYDWRRTLKSHDPRYYKWNQWFFTKFMENGLATRIFPGQLVHIVQHRARQRAGESRSVLALQRPRHQGDEPVVP